MVEIVNLLLRQAKLGRYDTPLTERLVEELKRRTQYERKNHSVS
jgi:hypothetical protein